MLDKNQVNVTPEKMTKTNTMKKKKTMTKWRNTTPSEAETFKD